MKMTHVQRNYVLGGLALLIVLASIIYVYMSWYASPHKNTSLYVHAGTFPVAQLHSVDVKTGALTPLTATVPGHVNTPILDMTSAYADGTYVNILENQSPLISNIYRKDVQGVYTKITNTDSIKTSLSYDSFSRTIAYQALASATPEMILRTKDWQVYTVSLLKPQPVEKLIGMGNTPALLNRGERMLVFKGDTLELVTFVTTLAGKASTTVIKIMDVPDSAPHALNDDKNTFAVYNPVTKSVDTFAISPASGLFTYKSSFPIKSVPTALGYSGADILLAPFPTGTTTAPQILTSAGTVLVTLPAKIQTSEYILSSITSL